MTTVTWISAAEAGWAVCLVDGLQIIVLMTENIEVQERGSRENLAPPWRTGSENVLGGRGD